jgi:hypothetical protein
VSDPLNDDALDSSLQSDFDETLSDPIQSERPFQPGLPECACWFKVLLTFL